MTTTPTERRLAITPDPMPNNNPKVSEPTRYTPSYYDYGGGASGPQMEPDAIGEYVTYLDYARLRQERDELVGALRATWNALEESPCDPDITADQIAAHAEMNKHNVPELLSKHRPE